MNAASEKETPNARVLSAVEWVDKRPKLSALILVLVSLPPLVLTVLFFSDVRAGLTELLPPNAPASMALTTLHERLGGVAREVVIAESPDGETNRHFIAELGDNLKAAKIPEIKLLQADVKEESEWARNRALLLMSKAKFEEVIGQAEESVKKAKRAANPMYVDLESDDDTQTQAEKDAEQDKLKTKMKDALAKADRYPNGYYETADGKTVLLMMSLAGSETELEPSMNLDKAVRAQVAAIRSKYPANLVVGFQGEVPNLVEEHDAILADLSLSSIMVFVLVGGVIFAFFRSMRGLIAVLFALTPGLLFTFAVGKLTVGHLNSNTAFLGSIIAGNGINYPLLFLAYFRGRPLSESRAYATAVAARQAFTGTLGAALAASAAYGALSISTFRGFSQFGWIGGVGMVTTWLFTFISMPIAIALFNPPRIPESSSVQRGLLKFFSKEGGPIAVAVLFVVLAVGGAAYGVKLAVENGLYETNLAVMRNRYSMTKGSASWDKKVAEVFGIWLNPVVALVDDPTEREKLAAALQAKMVDGPDHVAERVQTIATVIPLPEEQDARLVRIRKLAKAVKGVAPDKIPADSKPYLDRWVKPANLEPITTAELPIGIRSGFTEIDGRTDRIVLVFPSLKIDYNDSRNVERFDHDLGEIKFPKDAVVGGGFLFMAAIVELVENEAPRIVWVVALLVALVLVPLLRKQPLRILLVVATVAAVSVLSQANMVALGIRINMLSFAAMPITIGVGADYAVNLLGAMLSLKLDARRAVARMGGAIFLCSATTIIGYASLVIADSGALRTFGWAAVMGEIMAVSTVLIVLPVLMSRAVEKTTTAEAPSGASPADS